MSPKEIVKIAKDYLSVLFDDELLIADGRSDLRLEEIECKDDDTWEVTISFIGKGNGESANSSESSSSSSSSSSSYDPYTRVIGIDERREYKVVHLDADGKPLSVKVRPITVSRSPS